MGASDVQLTAVLPEHVQSLAADMRAEDLAECIAGGRSSGLDALELSLRGSTFATTLLVDGKVAAIFGFAPLGGTALTGPRAGCVWALTGNVVNRSRRAFLRASLAVRERFLELAPLLVNAVDARYTAALRWLRWLGFEVQPAVPYGPEGLPFHPIVLRRPHV